MNHRVPDFEMEDDYSIPASSSRPAARKSNLPDDEILELLWQNGQVVMQSQRSGQKKSVSPDHTTAQPQPQQPENQPQNPHLFIQEDEMVSWLQYPLGDEDPFGADLLYTGSSNVQSNNPPPIPPPRRTELQNFLHFSMLNDGTSNSRPPPKSVVKETTVVDSSETPSRVMNSTLDNTNASLDISMSGGGGGGGGRGRGVADIATAAKDAMTTCEMSLTSSPGRSSGSGSLSAEQMSSMKPPRTVEDRKRKAREGDDSECQSEDVDFESAKAKKQIRGSCLTKRSRAAEVHNLSERRRRDRINEKMKALQELIPRCNKSDKASMLDEAIEYLKSLQLQLQMMSMGCGMVPMMFPGVQQYMPMGMGLGMGMGMEMGMNRPMMPFANVLAGSTMPGAAAGTHMGPRFPIPPFRMQTMLPNDPNRVQATNQSAHLSNLLVTQNQNQSLAQHFADPYQQYLTPQQMQMQLQQNQAMGQPSCNKGSSSMGPENQENHE